MVKISGKKVQFFLSLNKMSKQSFQQAANLTRNQVREILYRGFFTDEVTASRIGAAVGASVSEITEDSADE